MTEDFEKSALDRMLGAGISREHIQLQKKIIFQGTHREYYYDKVENSEESCETIPVEKIHAMKDVEAAEGTSVYDLFVKIGNAEKTAKIIEEQLDSLEKNGLLSQQTSYSGKINIKGPSPLLINYYKDEDCFITQMDARYQTVGAKMFDAPFLSGILTTYQLNAEKKKLYDEYESLRDLLRLTDLRGLTMDIFQNKKNT
ncbi:hypothetical protein [Enterococcus gilvus]|uniref:hypothetical protein n=1 Tax=Enterococcus gilvus TaxID=160453 RepID=UPI003EDA2B04